MKRIHFHAGFPKCGSTAIQSACFAHTKQLSEARIHYPDNLPDVSNKPLNLNQRLIEEIETRRGIAKNIRSRLSEQPLAPSNAKSVGINHRALRLALLPGAESGGPSELFESVLAEFEASEAETLLLSCEGFALASERLDQSRLPSMAKYQVEVSYLVRSLPKYLTSIYKQKVIDNARVGMNIGEFIIDRGKLLLPSPRVMAYFAKFVGARKVHIGYLPDGGNALSILGGFLGYPLDLLPTGARKLIDTRGRTNVSLSNASALYCAELNRQKLDIQMWLAVVVALELIDDKIKQEYPISLLTASQVRRFTDLNNRYIDRLNDIYSANIEKMNGYSIPKDPVLQNLDGKKFAKITDMLVPLLDPEIGETLGLIARRLV